VVAAELHGGTQSFVAEPRRHADVGDDRIGPGLVYGGDERLGVADGPDLVSGVSEDVNESFA
jgi:hypothetical protein